VKIQSEVFWVVMPCSVAVEYQPSEVLPHEDGGSKVFQNVGNLPPLYTASQPRLGRSISPKERNYIKILSRYVL